ncbi:uncharacterized protein I303_107642 [Kwoniella dejecticola CBS 10117]|uniref:Uncharacterized protein n=1 Tax=Kwoniella dejecticola CBS 10117 TaxID=1296121 RepID=A0A1A5ZVB3_9TREE|nr:uncharacterized protein I303_07653 [Kwoniella dejecticola CBS 10117]OBR81743.1 hypothetical protein I303_07653 [Kwoniella dejecticola CBS 10117]
MQSVVDAAKSAANTATNLASTALASTGLTGHTHAEEHTGKNLPPDSSATSTRKMDSEGLAVFEDEGVRHEVLVKINKLAHEDFKHGLKEVAALELVGPDGIKKGIDYYHPLRYFTVNRPLGVDYIGEIEIEEGKSIHVRVHKAGSGNAPVFHSIDTRPSDEGGAVFKTGEPLAWFDY